MSDQMDQLTRATLDGLGKLRFTDLAESLEKAKEFRKLLPPTHPRHYKPILETRTDGRPSVVCDGCGEIKPCCISGHYDHWMCWLCDDCWEEDDND